MLNEQLSGIQNKIENNSKQIQNLQAMWDMLLKATFAQVLLWFKEYKGILCLRFSHDKKSIK